MARAWVCTCWSCWTRRCSCGRSTGVAARQSSANASACCLCCSVIDIDSAARAPPTSSAGSCSVASCASSWSDGYGSARGTKAATALSIDSIGRQRSDVCPTLIECARLELVRVGRALRLGEALVVEVRAERRAHVADVQRAALHVHHRVVVRHLAAVQQRDAALREPADQPARLPDGEDALGVRPRRREEVAVRLPRRVVGARHPRRNFLGGALRSRRSAAAWVAAAVAVSSASAASSTRRRAVCSRSSRDPRRGRTRSTRAGRR